MNWTTEYPKEPGFYWIRNYRLNRWMQEGVAHEPNLARVYPRLDCFLVGIDWPFEESDLACAEWYGPIEPPTEANKTVADQWVKSMGPGEFSTLEGKSERD